MADRKTVALSTRVRFPPVQPTGFTGSSVSGKPLVFEAGYGRSIRPLPATAGRSAARISGSDPEDSGSSPLSAAKSSYTGVVQLDRTLGYEPRDLKVRVLPPVPFRGPSSKGQGTALRRLESAFESPGAGQIYARETDWEGTRLSTGSRRVRFPFRAPTFCVVERDRTSALTLTQVIVGSIPTYDAMGQSTTGRVPSLSKR